MPVFDSSTVRPTPAARQSHGCGSGGGDRPDQRQALVHGQAGGVHLVRCRPLATGGMLRSTVLFQDSFLPSARSSQHLRQGRQNDYQASVQAGEQWPPVALKGGRFQYVVYRHVVAGIEEGASKCQAGAHAKRVLLALECPRPLRIGAARHDQVPLFVQFDVHRAIACGTLGARQRRLAGAGRAADEEEDRPCCCCRLDPPDVPDRWLFTGVFRTGSPAIPSCLRTLRPHEEDRS
jgi:hypothetical protein